MFLSQTPTITLDMCLRYGKLSVCIFELFIAALHMEFVPDLSSDKLAETTAHPVDSLWSKLSVSFLLQALHAFGHLKLYLPPNVLAYFQLEFQFNWTKFQNIFSRWCLLSQIYLFYSVPPDVILPWCLEFQKRTALLAGQTFGEGSFILLQVTLVYRLFHFVSPLHFIILPKRAHMQAIADLQILGPLPAYFLGLEDAEMRLWSESVCIFMWICTC